MLKLLDDLTNIIREIETSLSVHLTDEDFKDGRGEIVHVFLHEACHAVVSNCLSWIHELGESAHTALDEVLARLLEEKIGLALGLAVHTSEEQVRELRHYPVNITVEQYEHLRRKWQQKYWPAKDVEGMATYTLNYLRQVGVIAD
jgi:hypothetical protein